MSSKALAGTMLFSDDMAFLAEHAYRRSTQVLHLMPAKS
jgi:hypothetical protein